ncbi:hypothetical protein [Methanosphaerula subterraneus]|uniref:hypothetical protein n=1 Tax=Methanosphaerula subterraneus TaxID=3350244 RepID=UPI003F835C9D
MESPSKPDDRILVDKKSIVRAIDAARTIISPPAIRDAGLERSVVSPGRIWMPESRTASV